MGKSKIDWQFVPNSPEYYEFIRKLRNTPIIRKKFIDQRYISKAKQKIYMRKYHANYFLCLIDGKPVGYIGVINGDIRIAVLPKYQRKNVGYFLVKNILDKFPTLQAKVKIDNVASYNLFKKAGFKMKYYLFEINQRKLK